MKRFVLLLLSVLVSSVSIAQMRWNQAYQQYINQYKDVAIEQMKEWKIPASITLAQGLLESGAGRSELVRKGNNHFGIKCHGWTGATVYQDDDSRNECFRAYRSSFDSYEDHSRFLAKSQRYRSLFRLKTTDYKGWARGLKAAGYATNPQYANKLIDLIQLYKLYEYDTAKDYDKFLTKHAKNAYIGELHQIEHFNGNYYVIARRGDTYRSIAAEMKTSYKKLAKYNERDKNDALEVGEIVWLMKKKKSAPKDYAERMHYVRAGESMYSIAQKYGIRLKYLYKINHLSPYYQIRVGDSLKLR
jgi:LysM repeat protein